VAADELYDGPYCVLSLVDNHTFKRLEYQVLDHDPKQADIVAFFQRFQARLAARNLTVRAITTDGSNLYPAAIREVFGAVPHQICQFHIRQFPWRISICHWVLSAPVPRDRGLSSKTARAC
jgi:hypothetical protein